VHDQWYLTPSQSLYYFVNKGALSVEPNTQFIVFILQQASRITSERESLEILNMSKGGKILQTTNKEIELFQQDIDNDLQEIDSIQRQNQSIIGKVVDSKTRDN